MPKKKSYIPKNNILQYSSEKKHSPTRLFRIGGIICAGLLLLLAGAFAFFFFSKIFKVSEITVAGNKLADNDAVLRVMESRIAEDSLIARVFGSRHLFFWMVPDAVQEFSSSSEIASVKISVDSVERKVFLRVIERDVVYIICRPAESACYGVTGEGIVFSKIPHVEGALMFKIDDETQTPIIIGSRYFSDPAFLEGMRKTNQALVQEGMRPLRVVVRDHALYDWDAIFSSGPVLRFSGTFIPSDLVDILRDVKKRADFSSLEYIDFRAENKVYYR